MAFPATAPELATAYAQIKNRVGFIKQRTQALRAASLATLSAQAIVTYVQELASVRGSLNTLTATPGLVEYARTAEANAGLDIVAEYNAVITQLGATTAWIADNFPQDGEGYKLAFTLSQAGDMVWRTFAPASLVGLRTVLDALIATIA